MRGRRNCNNCHAFHRWSPVCGPQPALCNSCYREERIHLHEKEPRTMGILYQISLSKFYWCKQSGRSRMVMSVLSFFPLSGALTLADHPSPFHLDPKSSITGWSFNLLYQESTYQVALTCEDLSRLSFSDWAQWFCSTTTAQDHVRSSRVGSHDHALLATIKTPASWSVSVGDEDVIPHWLSTVARGWSYWLWTDQAEMIKIVQHANRSYVFTMTMRCVKKFSKSLWVYRNKRSFCPTNWGQEWAHMLKHQEVLLYFLMDQNVNIWSPSCAHYGADLKMYFFGDKKRVYLKLYM